ANPAAERLLGALHGRVVGERAVDLFDDDGAQALRDLFAVLSGGGRPEEAEARLASGVGPFRVFGSFHRQDDQAFHIIRVSPPARGVAGANQPAATASILGALPDGFVATTADGVVAEVNAAFVDLVEAPSAEALRGAPLERWFDRPGVDFNVMMTSLKAHGVVRRFPAVLRTAVGVTAAVEVTAVVAPHGDNELLGFVFRVVRPESGPSQGRGPLPHTPDQLTDLIGHVPLKEVVRETTDVIERLCIEAALRLTGDNRASAAQMLGLSRQGLYAKLRRYGITDAEPDPEAGA
ncbi:MAG: helix-turn-helix domain-containing protein, partial [Pseudomonadota bacterium]